MLTHLKLKKNLLNGNYKVTNSHPRKISILCSKYMGNVLNIYMKVHMLHTLAK